MMSRLPLATLILFSFIGLSACSESGSGSVDSTSGGLIGQPQPLDRVVEDDPQPPPVDNSPELAAVAGLWNNSIAEGGPSEIDVIYLEFTASGLANNYDYRGDNVDQGDNCYVVSRGRISSLGGTDYRLTFDEGILEFSAVVNGGRLELTGNAGMVVLPAVVGLSSVDFNLC